MSYFLLVSQHVEVVSIAQRPFERLPLSSLGAILQPHIEGFDKPHPCFKKEIYDSVCTRWLAEWLYHRVNEVQQCKTCGTSMHVGPTGRSYALLEIRFWVTARILQACSVRLKSTGALLCPVLHGVLISSHVQMHMLESSRKFSACQYLSRDKAT